MSETQDIRGFEAAIFAERLAIVAMSLFAVYLASVLVSILPPRFLNPIWQISSIRVAVDAAAMPLFGLALLHLAAFICPGNIRLQNQRNALAGLAILAALGFLLSVPLQGYAVLNSYQISNAVANQRQTGASRRADAVRQAIEQATTSEDLLRRLRGLQSPELRISLDSTQLSAIPLPKLKQDLLSRLNQAEGQFKTRFAPIPPAAIDRITRESLRYMASSLAFAIAFAALAQRRNSQVPFLVEAPSLPGQMMASLRPRRPRPGQESGGLPFGKSAAQREKDFFASLAPPEEGEEPPAS